MKKLLNTFLVLFVIILGSTFLSACGNTEDEIEVITLENATLMNSNDCMIFYIENDNDNSLIYGNHLTYSFVLSYTSNKISSKEVECSISFLPDRNEYFSDWKININNQPGDKSEYDLVFETSGIDRSSLTEERTMVVKVKGFNTEYIKGEAEFELKYKVVHYIKNCEIGFDNNFKKDYQIGEQLNLSGLFFNCTYEDNTIEKVYYNEALNMPQFTTLTNGNDLSIGKNFDSSEAGMHKSYSAKYITSSTSRISTSLHYNVLPNSEWQKIEANYFNVYVKQGMVASNVTYKDISCVKVDLQDGVSASIAYANNYFFDLGINEDLKERFQTYINAGNKNPFALMIPENNVAEVTKVEYIAPKCYKIDYKLKNSNGDLISTNTIYTRYENLYTTQIMTINVLNSNQLQDKSTLEQFIKLLWFSSESKS